jgi:hypothetical protein
MLTDVYIDFDFCETAKNFSSKKRIGHIATLSYLPYNLYASISNIFLTYNGRMTSECANELYKETKRFEIYNTRNSERVSELCQNMNLNIEDCISGVQMNALITTIGTNYVKWNLRLD